MSGVVHDYYNVAHAAVMLKKPDTRRALQLLRQAVAKSEPSAALALATWHHFGEHVPKDPVKAVTLLKVAAAANFPVALYNRAVSYEKGKGIHKSDAKAYEHYLRAAVWGESQAVYEVGRCLFYGIGIARNRRLARIWLDRADALGEER